MDENPASLPHTKTALLGNEDRFVAPTPALMTTFLLKDE